MTIMDAITILPAIFDRLTATATSSTTTSLATQASASHTETHDNKQWLKEYVEGVAMEVYATKLIPAAFYGLSFAQAGDVIYQCFGGEVITMGVHGPYASTVRRAVALQAGAKLPHLKVDPMQPAKSSFSASNPMSSSFSIHNQGDNSPVYINPGHSLRCATCASSLARSCTC